MNSQDKSNLFSSSWKAFHESRKHNICAFRGKKGNKACIISVSRTFLLYRATVSFNMLLYLILD